MTFPWCSHTDYSWYCLFVLTVPGNDFHAKLFHHLFPGIKMRLRSLLFPGSSFLPGFNTGVTFAVYSLQAFLQWPWQIKDYGKLSFNDIFQTSQHLRLHPIRSLDLLMPSLSKYSLTVTMELKTGMWYTHTWGSCGNSLFYCLAAPFIRLFNFSCLQTDWPRVLTLPSSLANMGVSVLHRGWLRSSDWVWIQPILVMSRDFDLGWLSWCLLCQIIYADIV